MDSRAPCVINWGAGFIYQLPCHSKWWNTEWCVRNAGVFDPIILSFVVVFPDLRKGYIFVIHKAHLKMELEIRSFCKWLTAFPLNLRMETIFPPKFSVFLMFLCQMNLRFLWKTQKATPMTRTHSPNVTDQGSPARPGKPLTSCMVWMCYVLYHWPFYKDTWARPESFWDKLFFQRINLLHPWTKVIVVSKIN